MMMRVWRHIRKARRAIRTLTRRTRRTLRIRTRRVRMTRMMRRKGRLKRRNKLRGKGGHPCLKRKGSLKPVRLQSARQVYLQLTQHTK